MKITEYLHLTPTICLCRTWLLQLQNKSSRTRMIYFQTRITDVCACVYMHACVHACLVVSNSLWLHGLWPTRFLCPWNFKGRNTGIGCHFLLLGIFLTQELNLHLLHWQAHSLSLCCLGSPTNMDMLYSTIQSCPALCNIMYYSQAPLSTGFSRQEYWNSLPFPTPGDLPDPRIEPASPESPALQAPGKPTVDY